MEDIRQLDERRPYTSRRRRPNFGRIAGWTLVGVVFAAIFALVFGLVIKWLWNGLMPDIFGLGEIGYWQAVGLVLLTKMLFGSFGHAHSMDHRSRDHRSREWPGANRAPGSPWSFCNRDFGMKDRFRKWHYYQQFWSDEGQAAFNDYLERMEKNGKEPEDHDQ